MSSKSDLKKQQLRWAESIGIKPDMRGYLDSIEDNLWRPLSARTRKAFENGSGSELLDGPKSPAKMRALHSSSALAVNVFDFWVGKDAASLMRALGIEAELKSLSFETQFPTGLKGNPPNLDIVLELESESVIPIESKFSEWLTPKPKNKEGFKPKYFQPDIELWKQNGLPESQALATEIYNGTEVFKFLEAPQLLKHALGLATQLTNQFSLYYLYYDWPGPESEAHRIEINSFAQRVGSELRFRSLTYQELFRKLCDCDVVDPEYLSYLGSRYFPDDARNAVRP
jgi:Restriction Endonuclease associating with ARP